MERIKKKINKKIKTNIIHYTHKKGKGSLPRRCVAKKWRRIPKSLNGKLVHLPLQTKLNIKWKSTFKSVLNFSTYE